MNKQQLSAAIDRLVESSIRRILPRVMNEVLLRTIADSGVLSEERPRVIRRKKGPKRRLPRAIEAKQPRRPSTPQVDLNEMLDDSVGADAYDHYETKPSSRRSPPVTVRDDATDDDGPSSGPPLTQRLTALDPSLRAMAEGLVIPEDDGGEMWTEDEHDSTASSSTVISEIRDVHGAAKQVGMDFSKMRALIDRTSVPKGDADDVRARASFEAQRLKRMRERLNDGKPVD